MEVEEVGVEVEEVEVEAVVAEPKSGEVSTDFYLIVFELFEILTYAILERIFGGLASGLGLGATVLTIKDYLGSDDQEYSNSNPNQDYSNY